MLGIVVLEDMILSGSIFSRVACLYLYNKFPFFLPLSSVLVFSLAVYRRSSVLARSELFFFQ